ncbi:hypothetical protein EAI_05080 [Harpegnathos saltator]|uniref:Uncharacterized protein n=1 Tax=Harpegnathos saltator TaxID=610380 RepID=E2C5S7_HARSA|nr:hypothetical protein EAI_05080 [Harpegnathos saltator]
MAMLDQTLYEWYLEKMTKMESTSSGVRNEREEDARGGEIDQGMCSSGDLTSNTSSGDSSTNEIGLSSKRDLYNITIDRDEANDEDTAVICNEPTETNAGDDHTEEIREGSKVTEQRAVSGSVAPILEVIQVWNNPAQAAKMKKKLENTMEIPVKKHDDGELAKQLRRRLSFDTWKQGKNLIYRGLLKEAEKRKQQELREKICEIERKKAYARILRDKETQQRTETLVKRLQTIHQMDMLQREIEERRVMNAQAFDAWKRQKDMKSRRAKLIIEDASHYQPKRSAGPTPAILTERPSARFNLWLDCLNSVLHKKHWRERLHSVRPSYCQPSY